LFTFAEVRSIQEAANESTKMIVRLLDILVFLLTVVHCNCEERCGSDYGCWFVPPGCIASECAASIRWTVNETIFRLQIDASLEDVRQHNMGAYVALGFSDDNRMGEDTVIECVYDGKENVRPFVSYNDGLHNAQLHAASELLILDANFSVFENKIFCDIELDFGQHALLNDVDKQKVRDVLSEPFFLQLARGVADPYSKFVIQ
uniref:DOMON domain-containing protein n=1 Tax=Toxocara canis TaxID=6265 RepID=A0A183V2U7_TOXCA